MKNTFEIPEDDDTLLKEVVESKIEPCRSRIDGIKRFKESRDQARIKDVCPGVLWGMWAEYFHAPARDKRHAHLCQ